MRHTQRAVAGSAAALALAALSAPALAQVPYIEGTWRLNVAASHLPGPAPQSHVRSYRLRPDGVLVGLAVVVAPNGEPDVLMFAARPDGHVEVQGGGFSLQPRFNAKGIVNGWQGTTSLTVQGRDISAIAELAGRVQTMTVGSLDYSVSREAREKVEGELAAQAIARFRAKAGDYAKAFGYSSFVVRDANVAFDNGVPQIIVPERR